MHDQLSLFAQSAPAAAPSPDLPDAEARRRIREDLDTSLLVEAGAGAGKTTEMVRRMVALVRSGRATVQQLAAVTFTRKAAAELRQRFQTAVEQELQHARAADEAVSAARLDAALRDIDRAFLGTIHAFCARLLRERPLEAGVDPGFRELLGAEERRLSRSFWWRHVELAAAGGAPLLDELRACGLQPAQVEPLFDELVSQPDVEYPADEVAAPDAAQMRRRLTQLLERADALMPAREPQGGWDAMQRAVRMLRFHRDVLGWDDDARFLDLLATFTDSSFDVRNRSWQRPDEARAMARDFVAMWSAGGVVDVQLRAWWASRYPVALRFARDAARAYEQERRRAGTLNFQDLLMFAARLLRESPSARRELSDRYRYLLVDEFQDTDPIQAEVLFLLASDEELDFFGAGADAAPREYAPPLASWRHLVPRPGALFVVGDPKQSIYRFRRADMTLYQLVRQRFASWQEGAGVGAVVELTTNFRSGTPIETFVNDTFRSRFETRPSEKQAPFAPMQVRPPENPPVAEGVFWYELSDPVAFADRIIAEDAERLATWIDTRIRSGEREPGDFLVLTPHTKRLAEYASALERRNVPLQVTGAGVGASDNPALSELRVLLRALAEPGASAAVVAVLVGLFFGLDYEQLMQHAEECGATGVTAPFSITSRREPVADAHATAVEQALAVLHRYWRWTREHPADVAVARIVQDVGLLPFAAAGELGESRAGALLFALDAIRAAALKGDATLHGAIAALESALDEADGEAPLEPGRGGVVRLMNLHKAKGLEARVVVLAMPASHQMHEPKRRIVRDESGRALGYLTLAEKRDRRMVPLAQPLDWDSHASIEQEFQNAEEDRLLYVAATRAAEELVVAVANNPRSPSRWRSFHEWLRANGTALHLPTPGIAQRARLERTAVDVRSESDAAAAARAALCEPTYRAASVTDRKAELVSAAGALSAIAGPDAAPTDAEVADAEPDAAASPWSAVPGRGTDWGNVVHDALLAAARGVDGDALSTWCRNLLVAHERPVGSTGEPEEMTELLDTIAAVLASPLWQRAEAAERRLVEVPFATAFDGAEYAALTGVAADVTAPLEIVEGRIDLAFREGAGWVIVDYKTDAAGPNIPQQLRSRYEAQLSLYRAAWERLTGEPVSETALLFTAGE